MYNLAKKNPYEMNLLKTAVDFEMDVNHQRVYMDGKLYNVLSNMSDKNKSDIIDAIYGTGDNITVPILIVENCGPDHNIESHNDLANRASLFITLKIKNVKRLYAMKYVAVYRKVSFEEYEEARLDPNKAISEKENNGVVEYYVGDIINLFEQGNYDCFDLVINPVKETIECIVMKANGKLPYKSITTLVKEDHGEIMGIPADLSTTYSSWLYPASSTLLTYGII